MTSNFPIIRTSSCGDLVNIRKRQRLSDSETDGSSDSENSSCNQKNTNIDQSRCPAKRQKALLDDMEIPGRGLKHNQHGPDFQLNLLSLVLWRACNYGYPEFRLATELPEAEKFDDVVFQYQRKRDEPWRFRLFQAKHGEGERLSIIDRASLVVDDDKKDFSLQKYFRSFMKIKRRCRENSLYSSFSGAEVEDITIVTNIDFSSDDIKSCVEIDHENDITKDELLGCKELQDACKYKILDASRSTLARELIPIFNGTSDFYRLVQVLASHVVKKSRIDKTVEVIKECTQPLRRTVFFSEKSERSDEFLLRFRTEFINCKGLSEEQMVFRRALLKEVTFLRIARAFRIKGPSESGFLSTDATHLKELSSKLAHAITIGKELNTADIPGNQKRLILALFNCTTGKIRSSAKDSDSNNIRKQLKIDLCRMRGRNKVTNKDLESIKLKFSREFGEVGLPSDLAKLNIIADALVYNITNSESFISSSGSQSEIYQNRLAKEVLDFSTGHLHEAFIDGEPKQGQSGSLSANAKEFRRILISKIISDDDLKDTLNYLIDVSLSVSKGLFDDFQFNSDLELNDPKKFAMQMYSILSSISSNKCVKINIGSLVLGADHLKVFKRNVCVLGEGHVLVDRFSKTRFSTNFLELRALIGNLNVFREELISLIGTQSFKSISEMILQVDIEGFQCHREELVLQTLPEPYTENDFVDFFEKLRIIVKYPNRFEITNFLEAEMRNKFRNLSSKAFSGLYQGILHRWMSDRVGTFYTAERAGYLFEEIDRDILCWPMDGVSRSYFATVPMKYLFKSHEDKLDKFLKDEDCQILSVDFEDILLGRMQIAQDFLRLQSEDSKELQKYTRQFGYMFFTLELLRSSSFRKDLTKNLEDKEKSSLLVVECGRLVKGQKLFKHLRPLLLGEPARKVVLITAPENHMSLEFETDPYFADKFRRELVATNFSDLNEESQNALLKNAKLLVQGRVFALSDLKDSSFTELIDSATLVKLINQEHIPIGNEACVLEGYDPSYYIERDLYMHVIVRSAAVEECVDEFVIGDSEEQFIDVCRRSGSGSVHWLRQVSNQLFWQRTRGRITSLVEYRDVDRECILSGQGTPETSEPLQIASISSEKDFLKVGEGQKFEIISNIAGMGKSTILSNMAVYLKAQHPSLWVIRIDLSDHTCFLNNELVNRKANTATLQSKDQRSVIRFLNDLLQCNPKTRLETEFEVRILANALKCPLQLKVALLFDAFDEISPTYKNIVLDLLIGLRTTHVQCVVVTTRPQLQKILERGLGVFACTLRQFSRSEQEAFLTKFWKRNILLKKHGEVSPSVVGARLGAYVQALIKKQFDTITGKLGELTGIPLQLRLLAEIFETSGSECGWQGCEEFINSENIEPIFPEQLNVFDLYHKFVEKKHWIYRKDKMRQDMTNVAVATEGLDSFKTFRKQHQKLAIYAVFAKDDLRLVFSVFGDFVAELSEVQTLINHIESGEERRGIVNQVKYGKPHFIHRTFADYFLVDLLRGLLLRKSQQAPRYGFFMLKVLSERRGFEVTLNFFDKWLAREKHLIPARAKAEFGESSVHMWLKSHSWFRHLVVMCVDKNHVEIVNFFCECLKVHEDDLRVQVSSRTRSPYVLRVVSSMDLVETMLNFIENGDATWEGKGILQNVALKRRLKLCEWTLQPMERDSDLASKDDLLRRTILDCAIDSGDLELCQRLFENGMDLNAVGHLGLTPLQTAALEGQLHITKWMISAGGEASARDYLGRDVVHFACRTGNLDVCQWLVHPSIDGGGGLDINVKTNAGRTLLHTSVVSRNIELLGWLVDQGIHIDCTDDAGWTPLHLAATKGLLAIVQWLLKRGSSIRAMTLQGKTLLHMAAKAFAPETCEWLMNSGLDPNTPDRDGILPIQLAASNGHLKLVQRMLHASGPSYGSHPNGDTLLHFAALSGRTDMCEWLLDCEQLLNAGIHINQRGRNGRTMLHLAMKNTVRFPQWLINRGADAQCKDDNGFGVLHYAAAYGRLQAIRWLVLDKKNGGLGLDPTSKSNDNSTVLHAAVLSPNKDLSLWLTNTIGLNIFEKNNRGQSAISIAEDVGRHCLSTLLQQQRNHAGDLDQAPLFPVSKEETDENDAFTERKQSTKAGKHCTNRTYQKFSDYFLSCLESIAHNKDHFMFTVSAMRKFQDA